MKRFLDSFFFVLMLLTIVMTIAGIASAQCGPGGCSPSGARGSSFGGPFGRQRIQYVESTPTYTLPIVTYDTVKKGGSFGDLSNNIAPKGLFADGWYLATSDGALTRWEVGICTTKLFPADAGYRVQRQLFDQAVANIRTTSAKDQPCDVCTDCICSPCKCNELKATVKSKPAIEQRLEKIEAVLETLQIHIAATK